MKTYIIASSEYHGNMPDLFLMDENGNYYGVSQHSYAFLDMFPKDINHWMTRTCSDADRFFNIDCVDIPEEVVSRFDKLTNEYAVLDAETPSFNEEYPVLADFKTKKAYREATDAWVERHTAWVKESNIAHYVTRKREIWNERTQLFGSLSAKVYDAIKYHDCFRYA